MIIVGAWNLNEGMKQALLELLQLLHAAIASNR
jgi:hypothetical protein